MARGMGGNYGMDQGTNPARQMSSVQPANALTAAPRSPRVGTGVVATVPATSGASARSLPGIGDTATNAMRSAATPTYGAASPGAVISSNRTPAGL